MAPTTSDPIIFLSFFGNYLIYYEMLTQYSFKVDQAISNIGYNTIRIKSVSWEYRCVEKYFDKIL